MDAARIPLVARPVSTDLQATIRTTLLTRLLVTQVTVIARHQAPPHLVLTLTQRLNPADIVRTRLTDWEQEVLGLTPGDTTATAADTPVLSEEATASTSVTNNPE